MGHYADRNFELETIALAQDRLDDLASRLRKCADKIAHERLMIGDPQNTLSTATRFQKAMGLVNEMLANLQLPELFEVMYRLGEIADTGDA